MAISNLIRRIKNALSFGAAAVETAPANPRKALGKLGEDYALNLLKKRGDKLVARNVLFKRGELDLVTWSGDTLVFTEVRTRSSTQFGTPAESVGSMKQASVRRAAEAFVASAFQNRPQPNMRFDVVWLLAKDGKIVESGIIEGY